MYTDQRDTRDADFAREKVFLPNWMDWLYYQEHAELFNSEESITMTRNLGQHFKWKESS